MIVQIKNPPTFADIESAIRVWLDFLADGNYTDAYEFTLHDSYYQWSPELLEQVIGGYGLPYEKDSSPKHKVTECSSATDENNQNCNREINIFDKARNYSNSNFIEIGEIYYDLPLDGEWSDLTATFKILKSPDFTTLELNEIHVM